MTDVLAGPDPYPARQGAGDFQLSDGSMGGGVPVQRDHPRDSMLFSRPGKEPLGGCCHLQLNRGAAHLETAFAINSGAKIPFLQLNPGAIASHFLRVPLIPHV